MDEDFAKVVLPRIMNRLIFIEHQMTEMKQRQVLLEKFLTISNDAAVKSISPDNLQRAPEASTIQQFADYVSSIIGFREAVTAKHAVLKYTWAILFVVGIAATVFVLYSTTNNYLKEPTLTRVELVDQPNFTFPPFVLCNDAWFDTRKALNVGLTLDAFKYSLGYWDYRGEIKLNGSINASRHEFLEFYHNRSFWSLAEYYKTISVDLVGQSSVEDFFNATVPSYYITGSHPKKPRKVFLPVGPICYEFFLNPVDRRVGFLFSPEKVFVKFSDKTAGLISVSQDWSLRLANDARSLYAWPLIIRRGSNSLLTIRQQRIISLSKDGSNCVHDSPDAYGGSKCLIDCFGSIIKQGEQQCDAFYVSDSAPADICNFFSLPMSNGFSYQNASFEIESFLLKEKETCSARCRPKCERMLYDATLEGDDRSWKYFQDGKLLSKADKSNMSVTTFSARHVGPRQGGIFHTEEVKSYTLTALVNDVGGTLGLFVGATLMTGVQIILFFVEYLFEKIGRK